MWQQQTERDGDNWSVRPIKSNQIKSNLFAINKVHNKQFIKITFHLAGQTRDSFALMSAHKN